MKSLIKTFFFLLVPFLLHSQVDSVQHGTLFSMGAGIHQGFVLVHSEDIRPVEDSYPRGFQFDFMWQQRGLDSWNKCRCFPKMGVAVQFWDFDNPEVLGYGINSFFFIEPEFGSTRKLAFSFRGGFGGSLLSQPYDEESNPDNLSYSTHLAFSLALAFTLSYRVSDHGRIYLSPYYNHISNGGVRIPNAGINYPTLSIGYNYYPKSMTFSAYDKSKWDRSKRIQRLDLSLTMAWKNIDDGLQIFTPGFEIKGIRQVGRISGLSLGMEYIEDNFAKYRFEQADTAGEWRKLGAAIGHEFLLGKLIFSQQLGVYLYNPDWEGDALYQRWGLVYFWTPHFATGVNLKAHRNVADFIDFRVTIVPWRRN